MAIPPDTHKKLSGFNKKQIFFIYNVKDEYFRYKKMLVISKKKLNDYDLISFFISKKRDVLFTYF